MPSGLPGHEGGLILRGAPRQSPWALMRNGSIFNLHYRSRLQSASGYPILELVDLRVVRTTIATEVITDWGIQRFGGPKLEQVSVR